MPRFHSMEMFPAPSALAFLVDLTIKIVALIALAAIAAQLLQKSPAATRHLVWLSALIASLFLPAASFFVPEKLTTYWTAPAFARTTTGVPLAETGAAPNGPAARASIDDASILDNSNLPASEANPTGSPDASHSFPWVLLIAAVYASGTFAILLQITLGIAGVVQLSRTCDAVATSSTAASILAELKRQLGIQRAVSLRIHDDVIPMTWGWRRPIILLPPDSDTWETERIRVVLLHELAHIARFDWPTQMLTHLVCALHWANPLVWWAASRMRAESECACDDRVLLAGVASDVYARHLLEIAQAYGNKTDGAGARLATPIARPGRLEVRLRSLLDLGTKRGTVPRAVSYSTICVAVIACVSVNLLRLREASANDLPFQTPLSVNDTKVPSILPQPAFTRTLLGGASVGLFQVSKAVASGAQSNQKQKRLYWRPDGTRLSHSFLPGADDRALQIARKMPSDNQFEFVFVFNGLSKDQTPIVKSTSGGEFTIQLWLDPIAGQYLKICSSDEPVGHHTASFKIGVAGKAWMAGPRILLSHAAGSTDQLDPDIKMLARAKSVPRFARVYPYDAHDSTFDLVIAIPSGEAAQQRIQLFDKHDQLLTVHETTSASGTNYVWKSLKADKSTFERAAYAVVETRPYSFVTIDNVPLEPKGAAQ